VLSGGILLVGLGQATSSEGYDSKHQLQPAGSSKQQQRLRVV
jgi:hypothetical protein